MRETTPPERVPGNFYFSKMFVEITIDGKAYVGCPKQAIRVRGIGETPTVVRWGSPVELAWPNRTFPRVRWVDEPSKGVAGKNLASPEDLLGAEGTIEDKKCYFERILDVGQHQIVFSLFFPKDQFRMAYGFSRQIFESGGQPTSGIM
jgi:hypothetical protein